MRGSVGGSWTLDVAAGRARRVRDETKRWRAGNLQLRRRHDRRAQYRELLIYRLLAMGLTKFLVNIQRDTKTKGASGNASSPQRNVQPSRYKNFQRSLELQGHTLATSNT